MASSVYSRVLMGYTSSLFAGLQVRWYYIVDFIVDFPSKKRGLIFSVKLQQNYKEKNITTTMLPEHNINKVR